MNDYWWTNGFFTWSMLLLLAIFQLNFIFSSSLNHEGIALLKFRERVVNDPYKALSSWKEENGEANPCSWFGIGCVGGHVVSLNLINLSLEGTLAPELHQLLHIKSIILRNNSFSGFIPEEYRNLKELELLDLGYNRFCEPITHEIEQNIPNLLLNNNGLSCHMSPDVEDTTLLEIHEDKSQLRNYLEVFAHPRQNDHAEEVVHSRILQEQLQSEAQGSEQLFTPDEARAGGEANHDHSAGSPDGKTPPFLRREPPPPPPPRPDSLPRLIPAPNLTNESPPQPPPPQTPPTSSADNSSNKLIPIVAGAVGGFIALILVSLLLFLLRGNRIRKATGLSGQLKRPFVAGNDRSDGLSSDKPSFIEGMPNLKRSELITACEDFSNVIGSSSIGTIYKGTFSNGVEIAVISLVATSAKDWSRNLETQFRKKIETLSMVNHKNFVNIIGYCEEEEPFTRMMVFEYAPNGSLFEHLHVKEAEHLDWAMRLRVAMGMAYCLEHMHQLTPPVTHPNLNSSAVNLSEDYAAKISDFCFWNEVVVPRVQPLAIGLSSLSTTPITPESNVYSYGLLLLEMMTGRIPHSVENNSLDGWVLEYMKGEKPIKEMVDPMLRHYKPEQLDKISEVIRKCLHSEQNRLTMIEVTARLKEITGIIPDKAVPRFSSLWWTELDARSVNGT
ncbi:probable inactive receptor-like protein kinase At3g56050 isoform X2 [Chenopodium quinoa]|uniref:probable inactive receptor-like protein kinase At3g56050 isoform X2 n=1 Tax=Chenopodium quinoa TaxID=63459 RepID=UPI000B78CF0C|nr:probable inactive receptor-like protein kinase At3g56050 isoform X2 [Chenopodium quinoa]